jgi:diguanylate cyclase (GGDEF)-like protein/PAS domain S-box-containing protein
MARPPSEVIGTLQRVLLLPLFALALLAALWTAVRLQIAAERQTTHNEAVEHSLSLARTLAEHVSNILRQTDHATQLFKLKFEETNGALRVPEFIRHGGLMESVLPARLDLPVALVDRNGHVIDSAHGFLPADLGDESIFQILADGSADAPIFSAPMVEPATRKWLIQVARRLNDKAGNFAGIIIIRIDPSYFVDDYDRLNVDDEGALILMSRDGALSVGRVGEKLFVSDQVDFTPVHDAPNGVDELVVNKPVDAIKRIYSFRDMPRYALTAIVGIPEAAALARFEQHRQTYTRISAAATVLIIAVVALLMEQSARLRASMRTAQEAQATLRAAADGSLDAFVILKRWPGGKGRKIEDFVVADVNERGAAMINLTRAQLMGATLGTVMPTFHSDGFFASYVRAIESGLPVDEELELNVEGLGRRWLHQQVVPIAGGVAVTARDITQRKHAEIEIRDNRSFLQSLIEHLPLLISVKSMRPETSGKMVVWNSAAEQATGLPAASVIDRHDGHPVGFDLHSQEQERAMLARTEVLDVPERPFRRHDGSILYLHTMSVPLFDEDGSIEYILSIAEDITRRREQEQALRASEAELAAMSDSLPLGLMRSDEHARCLYINRTLEVITGMSREQALGDGWLKAIHPEDRAIMQRAREHLAATSEPFQAIVRCRRQDGTLVWTSIKIAAIRIDGNVNGYVGSIEDITTLREAELALRESEARLRTIADTVPAMVAYIDADLVYRFHNMAYEREFGRNGAAVHGRTVRETVGEVHYAAIEPYLKRVLAGEEVSFDEVDHPGNVERNLSVTYIPQRGGDHQEVVGFHVIRQDVTSQQREKRRLLRLAQIDALTGLTNRAGFMQKLSDAMGAAEANGNLMAVMYMDIDHFKPVNDTYGHNVGDALLKAFSARLTHTMRASDTVARLGGDEFTIIMEKLVRAEDASHIAAKIVTAMEAPFELDDVTVSVSTSIGLAFYRDGEQTPDGLLKQADMLLYQAKQAGRNTYRVAA